VIGNARPPVPAEPGGKLTAAAVPGRARATSGNQKAAAARLGVSRPTLIKYVERYGIGRRAAR